MGKRKKVKESKREEDVKITINNRGTGTRGKPKISILIPIL